MFVEGENGGLIYNLKDGNMYGLAKGESDLVGRAEAGCEMQKEAISTILNELAALDLGFFSEQHYFIDKMRPYSRYILSRHDLKAPNIVMAYLQITGRCNNSQDVCEGYFCAPCRCGHNNQGVLTVQQWSEIIDKLYDAGVRTFVLTGGDIYLYSGFRKILEYLLNKKVQVVLVLNHLTDLTAIVNENVSFVLFPCVNDGMNLEKSAVPVGTDINVLCHEKVTEEQKQYYEKAGMKIIDIKSCQFSITEDVLTACSMEKFYARKDSDACLNGRVYIDCEGNVIPCLERRDMVVGNLIYEDFYYVLKKVISNYWLSKIPLASKCEKCQWFYACPSCRFMDTDRVCSFHPSTNEWNEKDKEIFQNGSN
jgi:radical SAM protein with 4Fe4S-binding SPASM domain